MGQQLDPRTGHPSVRRPSASSRILRGTLLLTDTSLVLLVWGWALRDPVVSHPIEGLALVAATAVIGLLTSWALSLHRYRICVLRSAVMWRMGVVALATGALVAATDPPGDPDIALATVVTFVALNLGRARFDSVLRGHRTSGRFVRNLVAVGQPEEVQQVADLLDAHPETGFRLLGYVGPTGSCSVPRLGSVHDAAQVVWQVHATGAVLVANGMSSAELNSVARMLSTSGIPVHVSSGIAGVSHQRLRSHPVAHEPFFTLEPRPTSPVGLAVKRVLDIVMSTILLCLTAPVMALAAIAIRLDTPGPIIFRQHRIGRDGELITVHKLRTMTVDAEERVDGLRHLNERSGPLFKIRADPRVTRVGRWLRKSSIDELPQLVDAIAGRLSLVGPRPALPSEVEAFDEELREQRRRMRPGITGLWQVEARHNPSYAAYRHLDLFYVENWSLRLDLVILAATAQVVLADAVALLSRPRSDPDRDQVRADQQRLIVLPDMPPVDTLVGAESEGVGS